MKAIAILIAAAALSACATGPANEAGPNIAFVSRHAVCGEAATADVGLNARIDRCRVWMFNPSRQQVENFGKLPSAYRQFVSRPPL